MTYNPQARAKVLSMPQHEILCYEIARAGWTEYVSWWPLQKLAGSYFAWKSTRICRRFHNQLVRERLLAAIRSQTAP